MEGFPKALSWRPLSEQDLRAGVCRAWGPSQASASLLVTCRRPVSSRVPLLQEPSCLRNKEGKASPPQESEECVVCSQQGLKASIPSPLLGAAVGVGGKKDVPSSPSLCSWSPQEGARALTATTSRLSVRPGSHGF